MAIAMTLKEWMQETGVTAQEVANRLGVDRTTVSRFVNDRRRPAEHHMRALYFMSDRHVGPVDWYPWAREETSDAA